SILEEANVTLKESVKNQNEEELKSTDLLLLDVDNKSEELIDFIKEIKIKYEKLKLLILDRNKDSLLFKYAIKHGADGYIVDINDKEDFLYSVKKVLKGKNIYEAELIESIIREDEKKIEIAGITENNITSNDKVDMLSRREVQVVKEVAKGLDNKTIAKGLAITEYTVKKHVKSICNKLNLRNRKEIIVYMSKIS
ncbi:MAG: LuxR C-terminal-related transcriptional regulator, partial [Peptostreptococcaceae bacterium]